MDESEKIWAIVISAIAGVGALASAFINLSIAGPIIGVIAGSVITYFAQSRSQKRLWKRDFIIENIKTIYGPLYSASLRIEQHLLNIDNARLYTEIPVTEWNTIQSSYAYHMIDDVGLRKEIENFYVLVGLFNELANLSWKLSNEIIQKRGSKFYGLNVRNINYDCTTIDGGSSPSNIPNCVLFKIHPKDANYFKTGKPVITIEHQVHNTVPRLILDSTEDIKKFEDLWNQMINDVNQDPKLQQLESLKLQIHTKNLEIQQKLVEKINERHNL